MISEAEFHRLAAQGYNRIPLVVQAFADLDTPLSLYLKLACGGGSSRSGNESDGHAAEAGAPGTGPLSFLLESVVGGERFGRYSFIGLPARTLLRARGFGAAAVVEVVTDGRVVERVPGNPLDFIAAWRQRFLSFVDNGEFTVHAD